MQDKGMGRRPPDTGSLFVRTEGAGRQAWYGKWREGGRQVKRRLGPARSPGADAGLTRREAEALLRRELVAGDVVLFKSSNVSGLQSLADRMGGR